LELTLLLENPMKKMMQGALGFAVLAMAAMSAGTLRAADTYEVKFQRPNTVGQKFDCTAAVDMNQTMKLTVADKELKSESDKGKYSIEAELEVTGVTDKGVTSKVHLVIKKLQAGDGDAAPADVATSGLEADATYSEGKVDFAASKGELSDAAKKALTVLFEAHDPSLKVTQDDIMGAKEPKKIGDTWNMDIKALSEAMGGASMAPEKTKGTVKLEGTKQVDGKQWLEFKQTLDGTDITVPQLGAAKEAKISVHETQLMPVDVKDPSEKSDGTRAMHAVFEMAQEGQTMVMAMDRNEKRSMNAVLKK
jgi:hypothetical protein